MPNLLFVIMKHTIHEKIPDRFFVFFQFSILSHLNWRLSSINILFIRKDQTHDTICDRFIVGSLTFNFLNLSNRNRQYKKAMITSIIYFLEGTEFTRYKIMLPAMTCQQHYYRTKFTFPLSFEVIVYATKTLKYRCVCRPPCVKYFQLQSWMHTNMWFFCFRWEIWSKKSKLLV